jgi:tetratricopeptide (TPR) repeat protein
VNVLYHSQLGLARALELYGEAAGLDRRHKDLYNNLGVMLTGSGRQAAKLAAYQRAHAMAPDDAGIMRTLATHYVRKGGLTRPNHCTIVP